MGGTDEAAYASPDSGAEVRKPSGLAVCLVSGGMDSCVTAAIANEEANELAFLHVSYGQRTEERERRAFAELADHFALIDVWQSLSSTLQRLVVHL